MRFSILFTSLFVVSFTYSQTKQDSLILKTESLPNNEELVDTYLLLAKNYKTKSIDTAFYWVDKMEKLSQELDYKKGLYNTLKTRGDIYYYQGKPDSAIVYFKRIFNQKLAQTAIDSADVYNFIGVSYDAKGDVEKALSALNLGLDIYEKEASDSGLLTILVNMGNAFYQSGNTQQALKYFKQAYDLGIELEDAKNLPIIILNYAMLSLQVEKDTKKVDQLLENLANNKFIQNDPNVLSTYYQNIAVYYNYIDELNKAETNFKRARNTSKNGSLEVNSGIYAGLAQVYIKKNNYKLAIKNYHKALKTSSKKSEFRLIYNDLAKAYTNIKQTDSASFYWEKNIKVIEELEKERFQNLMLKSKNNLDVVQKEHQIELLEQEKEVSFLKQKINKYTIAGLIAFIIVLSIIAFLIFKQKKKELELKKAELKLKNQNLVNLSLQINQKNQVLKDFENDIVDDQSKKIDPIIYNNVKNALKKSLKIDKDWEDFELYFNDLYTGFYDNLKSKFPDLTNGELRVCSLVKLRFSLKEISQTLLLSVDSVKSTRYRIRKKLNLNTSDDLSDFLNSL